MKRISLNESVLKFFLIFKLGLGTLNNCCVYPYWTIQNYYLKLMTVFLLYGYIDLTATELIVYKMVILYQVKIINLKIKVCVLLLLRNLKILLES